MPVVDIATLKPTHRLLRIAAGDTGQSRTAAAFLLAWWNADSGGGFDLTDLWAVDGAIARDMLAKAALIAAHRECPTAFGPGPQSERLVGPWR